MKYIKTYEKGPKYSEPINVGDIVVCMEAAYALVQYGRYEVLKIYNQIDNYNRIEHVFCNIKSLESGEVFTKMLLNRFVLELEYFAKKYNL